MLELPAAGARAVDLIQIREDVRHGQKVSKYAIDALQPNGSWLQLKVLPRPSVPNAAAGLSATGVPPLQQTVGHRVVDLLAAPLEEGVQAVRFRCIAVNSTGDDTIRIASLLATARPRFPKASSAHVKSDDDGVSVFGRGEGNSSAYRIPGVISFRGTILAFAEQETTACSDRKSGVHNIVLKRSTTQGKSWSNMSVVVDVEKLWGAKAAHDGSLMGGEAGGPTPVLDERSGEVLLFFSYSNVSMEHATHHGSEQPYEYSWLYPDAQQTFVMSSTDGKQQLPLRLLPKPQRLDKQAVHAVGLTWGRPKLLTSLGAASEWCSNMPATGHGVQLPSGKLLVPGYHLRKCTKIDAEVVEEAHAWLSDGGVGDARRWKISAGFGTGVAEESFVPLFQSPGQPPTVRATFRVDAPSSCNCTATEGGAPPAHWPPPGGRNKCRRTATSTDEGLSWAHWWDQSSLPDPGCKGSYTRAEQVGAIIVGNNDDTRLRQNVTLSVSLDNGVTYPHKKTISGPGGYVDLTMVSDNLIGVLYEDGGCSIAMQNVDIRSILPPGHRGLKSDERFEQPNPIYPREIAHANLSCPAEGCLLASGRGCNRAVVGGVVNCVWASLAAARAGCAGWQRCEGFFCEDDGRCFARSWDSPLHTGSDISATVYLKNPPSPPAPPPAPRPPYPPGFPPKQQPPPNLTGWVHGWDCLSCPGNSMLSANIGTNDLVRPQ